MSEKIHNKALKIKKKTLVTTNSQNESKLSSRTKLSQNETARNRTQTEEDRGNRKKEKLQIKMKKQ
jgi:hypothetical protein